MGGGGLALRVAATWALARAGFSDTELGAGVLGRVLGVADMDGDGTLDVVTASADRFTVVYNTAEGFVATDSGADGSVAAVAALALADLDGDGAADVLLAAGASVQIWQVDGDMTTPLVLRWETELNSGAGCLDVFDVTGDGLADFFAGQPEENLLSSYRRLGDDFVEGDVDDDAGGVVALVHGDVDGDGDVDAFAAYGALNAVAYLKNDGAGNEASFSRILGTEDGMAPNAIFGNVDVDGDGNLDLLVTGDDGRVYWYENIDLHEGGTYAILRDISSATDGPRSVQGVDVDGDGDVDVLVASYFDDAVTWFENQGEDAAGTLQFAQHAVKSTSYARGLVEQVTGTWGDICLDETSLTGWDGAVLSYGDGSSGDNSASDVLDTSAEYISRVRQASYSGSSQCDEGLGGGVYYEVSSIYETSVVRYFNFGAGDPEDTAATTAEGRAADWAASWPCQIVGLVVDGDGDPATVDTIAGVETNCDGGTFPIPTGTLYDDTCVVVAADLDGDGDADVVSASSADGKAWWHESVGDATAAPAAAPNCGWAARDEWSTTHASGWFVARVDDSAVATDVPLGVFIDGELWGLSEASEALPDSSGDFAGMNCYSTSIFSDGTSAGADITYKLCLDGAALAADAVSLDAAETLTDGEYGSTSYPVFLDFPSPTAPTPRPTLVSEATLVAHYSFDDGTAADVAGGLGLDGTITGATATAGPGGSRALAFDGVDDIATFPAAMTADVLGASSRTVCLWATVDAWNGAALFSYGAADDDMTYFAFETSHEPGEFALSFQSSNVVLWGSDDGAWHHYCVTYADGWLKLYFDGRVFYSSSAFLYTGDGQNFIVGGAGSDAAYFDGAVDDLYVYSSQLDDDSIRAIFELTGLPTASPTLTPPPTRVSQSTLVAYYSFDDGTAAEDTDSSLNGTVFGATATTGPDGSGALSFDGGDSAAAFPAALTGGLLGIAHRTVCLWATIDAWNGAALFWYGTPWSASDNQQFALKTSSAGSVDVYFNGAGDAGDVALAGSDDGAWHHYCVAYDGAFWVLYFDGQQASTGAAELNTGDEYGLQVGGLFNFAYFDGAVDDLYVYSSALDAASIQHIFELTGTPTAAPTPTPPPPSSNGELCDCASYANGATENDAVLCVPNSGQCRPPNDGDGLCSSDAPACVLSDAPTPHPTSLFSTLAPTPASLYYDCRRMANTICDDDLMEPCVVGPRDCGDLDEETCFYEDCNPCAAGAGDAMCACGILSVYGDDANLCCWGGCGECGGQACDERPGGPDACCHGNINSSGDICQVPSDTACAVPDPLDDTTIREAVAAWAWGPETATATYGDIGSWDTSMVTDFSELFCASADDCGHTYAEAATFDEDVGYWDVSAAVTMKSMFRGCDHFDRDLGGWDVSAVTDMSHMFASAGAFDRDLGWCQRFSRVLTGENRRVP